jgi:hypothetical protein
LYGNTNDKKNVQISTKSDTETADASVGAFQLIEDAQPTTLGRRVMTARTTSTASGSAPPLARGPPGGMSLPAPLGHHRSWASTVRAGCAGT